MVLPADPEESTYVRMRWNAPLSEEHAALLVDRLDVGAGMHVVDLGCGWGELLMRALRPTTSAIGVGVDTDEQALERGRAEATKRGLADRVTFLHGDAAAWTEPADRVICVGASHALGGTDAALRVINGLVPPGGRVLFGEGCWEHRPPTEAALAIFGDEVLALPDLVERVLQAGWRVLHLGSADQREWDDFESTWRAGRQEWLADNPGHERAADVQARVDAQLRDYVGAYRGVLGFVYLVLAKP
jgi:cyclopropane fatty-acyl-phospholipid synthase-like methyltransferase